MISGLDRIPRRGKQLLAASVDAVALALAMWLALAARLESWWPTVSGHSLVWLCTSATIVGIPCCYTAGLYREITRYVGLRFALHVAYAVSATVLILAFVALMADRGAGLPRSALVGFWMAALLAIGGSRAVARYLIRRRGQSSCARMIIYGAGDVGAGLVSMLSQDQRSTIVAFVDDDPSRVGTEVRSLRIYPASEIRTVVRTLHADTILLALPESSRRRRREIFQELTALGLRVMLVPTLAEIAEGTARTDSVRAMKIEDLLGRNPVEPKTALLSRNISGANVLVTGAGGSIGSETARQVLRQGPRRLVVLDNCEFNLYTIENELRRLVGEASGVQIVAVLGSVLDRIRLEQVIVGNSIDTIYHAAAYKHVPIVEANEVEGVAVNVLGTLRTAQVAEQLGVKSFVLISTDKAVRPTSVMGASKRLAEKCLQAMADHAQRTTTQTSARRPAVRKTRFVMVRFGNVLASSGSVVPLFTEQIRRGGPVTLTHPDITRYFMTIPEASSLVIQAGAMGAGGDVFVLDMGEPVKIIDLARNMIRLAGYREKSDEHPEGDIEIHTTGLRPGEKLYEELLIGDNCGPTEHPAIMQAKERFIPWDALEPSLTRLESSIDQHDTLAVRELLEELVSGYHKSLEAAAESSKGLSHRTEGVSEDV